MEQEIELKKRNDFISCFVIYSDAKKNIPEFL